MSKYSPTVPPTHQCTASVHPAHGTYPSCLGSALAPERLAILADAPTLLRITGTLPGSVVFGAFQQTQCAWQAAGNAGEAAYKSHYPAASRFSTIAPRCAPFLIKQTGSLTSQNQEFLPGAKYSKPRFCQRGYPVCSSHAAASASCSRSALSFAWVALKYNVAIGVLAQLLLAKKPCQYRAGRAFLWVGVEAGNKPDSCQPSFRTSWGACRLHPAAQVARTSSLLSGISAIWARQLAGHRCLPTAILRSGKQVAGGARAFQKTSDTKLPAAALTKRS